MKDQASPTLFVRLDRIGDLVLSLPVDESFDRASWWIPKGLKFVTDNAEPKRNAKEVARKISARNFWKLFRETKRENFQTAVVFHAPWWVGLLLFLARIPVRVGVRSQWHSFLFFNRGVRQKRSRAEHSELEYNFLLAEAGLGHSLPRTSLQLRSAENEVLPRYDLAPGTYSVVHPGMGGSALNWPIENYEGLVRELVSREKVAITGTPADEPYVAPLRERLRDLPNVVWLDGKLKGPELISVLANARTVTAPSTGVLHLAASTGVPTLGLFSPVRVQQPKRWGPQGARTKTLMPQVECPGEMSCLGPACPLFDCMKRITVSDAVQALDELAFMKGPAI